MKYELAFHGKVLLACTLLLSLIGVLMVYSASVPVGQQQCQDGYFFLKRHLLRLALGLAVMRGAWRLLRAGRVNLRYLALPFISLSLALLAAVLYSPWSIKIRGARRWLGWGEFSFQPLEPAKFGLVFCVAYLLTKNREKPERGLVFLCLLGLLLGAFQFLVLRQPDLGNSLLLCVLSFVMLFLTEIPLIYLASLAVMSFCGVMLWLARYPYVQKRLAAFLSPWQHAAGSGFQAVQSFIALGKGGVTGVGLGAGSQKWGYLPEAHTDFILAIIGEEWGLAGTVTVLGLFGLFTWAGLKIAADSEDVFSGYLAAGITCLIGLQALFNIWVVTGLFPNKGIPLPFVSYGGTSLVASMLGVGLLLALASRRGAQEMAVLPGRRGRKTGMNAGRGAVGVSWYGARGR